MCVFFLNSVSSANAGCHGRRRRRLMLTLMFTQLTASRTCDGLLPLAFGRRLKYLTNAEPRRWTVYVAFRCPTDQFDKRQANVRLNGRIITRTDVDDVNPNLLNGGRRRTTRLERALVGTEAERQQSDPVQYSLNN